jgi:nanoRNase/pAp phosphatase (c-di-AMP/oligoRNAs hydrolase)
MAEGFVRVYRRPRRATIGLAFGLATALMLGIYGASGTFASASSTRAHATRAHVTHSTHAKQPTKLGVKRQH